MALLRCTSTCYLLSMNKLIHSFIHELIEIHILLIDYYDPTDKTFANKVVCRICSLAGKHHVYHKSKSKWVNICSRKMTNACVIRNRKCHRLEIRFSLFSNCAVEMSYLKYDNE